MYPTIPPYAAGFLIESPVSLPMANGTIPLATADALPALLPPIYPHRSAASTGKKAHPATADPKKSDPRPTWAADPEIPG